jgi:hypothetical protein
MLSLDLLSLYLFPPKRVNEREEAQFSPALLRLCYGRDIPLTPPLEVPMLGREEKMSYKD